MFAAYKSCLSTKLVLVKLLNLYFLQLILKKYWEMKFKIYYKINSKKNRNNQQKMKISKKMISRRAL